METNIYSIVEVPDWVKISSVDNAVAETESPFNFPLVDYQELVNDQKIVSYKHTYECINDESRIENASLQLWELHQGSQALQIHELVIYRDGKRIDALDAENISAIQRERSLESHITDSRITVSISIDDLRVGDHLEFKTSLVEYQSNHPFHGRFFHGNYGLSWGCPVSVQSIRIINNSKSELSSLHQLLEPPYTDYEGETISSGSEYSRKFIDHPTERIPDAAPARIWGSFLQVTSKESWEGLSTYLYKYLIDNQALADLEVEEIEQLAIFEADDDLTLKALKIVRFVQNNIRYRGENHGVFTHTPKQPQRTLKKRSGDCKDKSNLMVAMLKTIGVESQLVLVTTSQGVKTKELNPSPYHFNHMIVSILIGDNNYFVDPTIQKQAGTFQHMAKLDYGWGLPLLAEGSDLVEITRPCSDRVFELTHRFDFPKNLDDAKLEIRRVYFSHRADNMRAYFSSNDKKKLHLDFCEWAKSDTGLNLEIIEPVSVIEDDLIENRLVAIEKYSIVDVAKSHSDKRIEVLTDFYREFYVPSTVAFPIRIDLDGGLKHEIIAKYHDRPETEATRFDLTVDAFEYADFVENHKQDSIRYLTKMTPLKREIRAGEEATSYINAIESVRQRSNNLIPYRNRSKFEGVYNNELFWYALIVGLFLAIKYLFFV